MSRIQSQFLGAGVPYNLFTRLVGTNYEPLYGIEKLILETDNGSFSFPDNKKF